MLLLCSLPAPCTALIAVVVVVAVVVSAVVVAAVARYRCSLNEQRTRRQIGSIFFGAFMNTKVAEKAKATAIRADYIGSIQ